MMFAVIYLRHQEQFWFLKFRYMQGLWLSPVWTDVVCWMALDFTGASNKGNFLSYKSHFAVYISSVKITNFQAVVLDF